MKRSELYMKKSVKQLFEMYMRMTKVLNVIDNNENVNLDSLYDEYIQPFCNGEV